MDIDVKNALDKVLAICESIERNNGGNAKDALAKDIFAFIRHISTKQANERFDYFSKLYLKGAYSSEQYLGEFISVEPETQKSFMAVDAQNKNGHVKTTQILVSFFTTLGKSYMSSSADRKDIDVSQFAEYIKRISEDTQRNTKHIDTKINDQCSQKVKEEPSTAENDSNSTEPSDKVVEPEESLEELLDKLNSLIGLDGVKKEVSQIINLIKVQKKGEEFGAKLPPLSLHLVFYVNPGTGKTTVARLLSKIYKCLGVLSQGQMIEVDRGGLVAGYVGQTATKTQEVIDKAMGGILFIDEAYALTHGKGETDFGQEAVDTILKAMEDHRDDFIVIVAGYPDLMKEFVASNPGLKSRFNQFINFEDYNPQELLDIFILQCRNQNLILGHGCEEYLSDYFSRMYNNRGNDYANGRDVRNYFEGVYKARANRLANVLDNISKDEYLTITVEDLIEAENAKSAF